MSCALRSLDSGPRHAVWEELEPWGNALPSAPPDSWSRWPLVEVDGASAKTIFAQPRADVSNGKIVLLRVGAGAHKPVRWLRFNATPAIDKMAKKRETVPFVLTMTPSSSWQQTSPGQTSVQTIGRNAEGVRGSVMMYTPSHAFCRCGERVAQMHPRLIRSTLSFTQ